MVNLPYPSPYDWSGAIYAPSGDDDVMIYHFMSPMDTSLSIGSDLNSNRPNVAAA